MAIDINKLIRDFDYLVKKQHKQEQRPDLNCLMIGKRKEIKEDNSLFF